MANRIIYIFIKSYKCSFGRKLELIQLYEGGFHNIKLYLDNEFRPVYNN